tara:strand:+ start:98 stop:349 length:252 start_codon:yes stop_codon:yes gene_type:complete
MSLQIEEGLTTKTGIAIEHSKIKESIFSKDYVDFLNEAGWRLEKKFPSNSNNYSDLLEDTEWRYNNSNFSRTKHYRRDLDALS